MPLRKGCQTITWGAWQKMQIEGMLTVAASAGYEGLEIGFRHLVAFDHDVLRRSLASTGLVLAATHIGGNLVDLSQAADERQALDDVLDLMEALDIPRVMVSGMKYEDDDQLAADLDALNAAAVHCAERGRQMLYHNHAFEFDHDRKVIDALLENTVPELEFCPDVGWVHKAGVDPLAFLQDVGDRIGAVHLKDFAGRKRSGKVDTVCLGDGVVPLDSVVEWLKKHVGGEFWVIAEQDNAAGFAATAVRQNAAYLDAQLRS